ncbi:uncharacterized protein [Argopecten irradians]|uniref:uncharacterized protein n=1 Tax=Argopecten irradians TaxID=31199 RepID=UPI003724AA67
MIRMYTNALYFNTDSEEISVSTPGPIFPNSRRGLRSTDTDLKCEKRNNAQIKKTFKPEDNTVPVSKSSTLTEKTVFKGNLSVEERYRTPKFKPKPLPKPRHLRKVTSSKIDILSTETSASSIKTIEQNVDWSSSKERNLPKTNPVYQNSFQVDKDSVLNSTCVSEVSVSMARRLDDLYVNWPLKTYLAGTPTVKASSNTRTKDWDLTDNHLSEVSVTIDKRPDVLYVNLPFKTHTAGIPPEENSNTGAKVANETGIVSRYQFIDETVADGGTSEYDENVSKYPSKHGENKLPANIAASRLDVESTMKEKFGLKNQKNGNEKVSAPNRRFLGRTTATCLKERVNPYVNWRITSDGQGQIDITFSSSVEATECEKTSILGNPLECMKTETNKSTELKVACSFEQRESKEREQCMSISADDPEINISMGKALHDSNSGNLLINDSITFSKSKQKPIPKPRHARRAESSNKTLDAKEKANLPETPKNVNAYLLSYTTNTDNQLEHTEEHVLSHYVPTYMASSEHSQTDNSFAYPPRIPPKQHSYRWTDASNFGLQTSNFKTLSDCVCNTISDNENEKEIPPDIPPKQRKLNTRFWSNLLSPIFEENLPARFQHSAPSANFKDNHIFCFVSRANEDVQSPNVTHQEGISDKASGTKYKDNTFSTRINDREKEMPIPKPRRRKQKMVTDSNTGPLLPRRLYTILTSPAEYVEGLSVHNAITQTECNKREACQDTAGCLQMPMKTVKKKSIRNIHGEQRSKNMVYDNSLCNGISIYADIAELHIYMPKESLVGNSNIYEQVDIPSYTEIPNQESGSRKSDVNIKHSKNKDYDYDYPDCNKLSKLAKAYEKWCLSSCPKCGQKPRFRGRNKLSIKGKMHATGERVNGTTTKNSSGKKGACISLQQAKSPYSTHATCGSHNPCACIPHYVNYCPCGKRSCVPQNCMWCCGNSSSGSCTSCSCNTHHTTCSCGNSSCESCTSCSCNTRHMPCSCGNSSCGSCTSCSYNTRHMPCSCGNSSCGSCSSCSCNTHNLTCSCANSSCGSCSSCSCNTHHMPCSCGNSSCGSCSDSSCSTHYIACSCGNSSCNSSCTTRHCKPCSYVKSSSRPCSNSSSNTRKNLPYVGV